MGWWMQTKITALEKSASALEWMASRRGRLSSTPPPPHLVTGMEGEKVGFFYLMRNGYTVVARRWSSNRVRGDLDLVAWQGQTLCIVEVKTRTAHDIVPAELSVDANKRAVLRRLTRQYIRWLPGRTVPHVRFDILSVYLVPGKEKEIVHFKDAFAWNDGRREWD
jgi:putative endonuclease